MSSPGSVKLAVSPSATHAALMFYLSIGFLGVVAIITQWWNSNKIIEADSILTGQIMLAIWTPFVVEAAFGLALNPRLKGNWKRFLLLLVMPPFRLTYSTFSEPLSVWLPGVGWRTRGEALFEFLEQRSMMLMLVIALMILPVLGIEFMLKEKVNDIPWLGLTLDASAAFIWFAFAFEFLLMVSVTDEKLGYCKKNWLNLVIILLPLISFLRGFQVVRAFRVAKAGKLLRVYRMRSLLLRIYQALVAISAIERLLNRNPQKHLARLQKLRIEKAKELELIDQKIQRAEARVRESETLDAIRGSD